MHLLYMDMNATLIVRDGTFMGVQAILRDIAVRQQLKDSAGRLGTTVPAVV